MFDTTGKPVSSPRTSQRQSLKSVVNPTAVVKSRAGVGKVIAR